MTIYEFWDSVIAAFDLVDPVGRNGLTPMMHEKTETTCN